MEKNRYDRISMLPDVGEHGINKLRSGSVLVIGSGALGSLCSFYLAGAGIGRIGIADFDKVDITNLHRQLFYAESDVNEYKVSVLQEKLIKLNSEVIIETYNKELTEGNSEEIYGRYDFIINCTDSGMSKFLTDNICFSIGKPFCIGGIKEFQGQVMSWKPGKSRYSDIFEFNPEEVSQYNSSKLGVHGPTTGVIASIQASEAIKYMCSVGDLLYNKIFVINLLDLESHLIHLE